MKIKILYSHYNTNQDLCGKYRPNYFSYEKCFKNFIKTIAGKSEIELHIIYDETRGDIKQNWLNNYNNSLNFTLHNIQGGSMFGAAKEMYRIAKELSEDMEDGDLFMFQENDYLYVNEWVEKLKELYQTYKGLSYVSLYNHVDKWLDEKLYGDLLHKIFLTNSHYWVTNPNTCGSYVCSKQIFLEDYDILTNVEGDCNKWKYLEDNRGRFVLTPLPGLSNHMVEPFIDPVVDWKKINELVS